MNPARNKGFTLVELLVVISIIAILSVIGIVVFTGIQKSSRDARRRADINAIANALEANKDLASGNYQPVTAAMFASGAYPFDPFLTRIDDWKNPGACGNMTGIDVNKCLYCFKMSNNPVSCSYHPAGDSTEDPYINISAFTGTYASLKTRWTICANLEASPGYYCKSSAQ